MKKIGKISAFALIVMLASFFVKVDAMVIDPSTILDITATEVNGQKIPTDVYVLGNYAFYNVYTTSDVLMAMNDYMTNTPATEIKPLTLYVLTADPYQVGNAPVAKIENALDAEDEVDEDNVVINLTKIYNLPDASEVADAANDDEEADVAETQKEAGKDVVVFKESYYVRFSYYNDETEEEEVITVLKDEGSALTSDEIPGNPIENDNYEFLGWFIYEEEMEEPLLVEEGLEINGNVEAYAGFEGKSANVTFHANGGYFREATDVTKEVYDAHIADPTSDDYDECYNYMFDDEPSYVCYVFIEEAVVPQKYGEFYTPDFPYRDGYDFNGWFTDQELTEELPDMVEDLTVNNAYAKWTPGTAPYYVVHRYMSLDGTSYEEISDFNFGPTESDTTATAQPREGFVTPEVIEQQPILGDGSTIVVIVYQRETYDVNFEVDGEVASTEQVKFEGLATRPEVDPVKDGYAFTGWTLDGVPYDFETPVTGEITLVAEFSDAPHVVSYIVNPEDIEELDVVAEPKSTKVQNGTTYGAVVNVPAGIPDGYAFLGWFLEDGTKVTADTMVNLTGDVILYARWNVLTFNIEVVKAGLGEAADETITIEDVSILNFNDRVNNTLNKSDIVAYVATLTTTEGLEDIEHFTTEDGVGTVVITNTEVATVTLNYARRNYNITFEASSGFADIVVNKLYGETYTLQELANAEGYTQEFYANKDYSGEAITGDEFIATGNLTYYVKLTPIEYSVSYVFNVDGIDIEAQPKNVNVTNNLETMLDVPAKVGYTFNGWFTDNSYEVAYTKWTGITSAVTLYGKFTAKEVTVTLNPVGGDVDPATIDVTFDDTYDFTGVEATKVGYTFAGWFAEPEYETEVTDETTVTDEVAHTLYAKWTLVNYNLTFNLNNGAYAEEVSNPATYTIESEDIELAAPIRNGYTFAGWFANSEFTGEAVTTVAQGSAGDKEFFAKWTPVVYTLTFNLNDGAYAGEENLATYTIESETIEFIAPVKDGYDFAGWFANEELTGEAVATLATGNYGNKVYYAKWTAKSYEVELDDLLDGDNAIVNVSYQEDMPAITVPEKEGYTFAGYYDEDDVKYYNADGTSAHVWDKTAAATLTAVYTPNEYTVSYKFTGTGLANPAYTTNVTFAAAYGELPDPTATLLDAGFEFLGWYLDKEYTQEVTAETIVTTASNHTLYAKYIDIYTITFNTNGGSAIDQITYTVYDENFALPTTTAKTGYQFDGWFDNEELTGEAIANILQGTTGDLTLYAKWTLADGYVVTVDNGATAKTAEEFAAYLAAAEGTVNAILLADVETNILVPADVTLNLDLAGMTLTGTTAADTIYVSRTATLKVTDSVGGAEVLAAVNKSAVFNNGTTTLNGGTFTRISQTDKSWYVITNHGVMTSNAGATVSINADYDGSSQASLFENGYYNYDAHTNERNGYVEGTNNAAPTLTINGGLYHGGLNTIKNDDAATLVINNGTFENFIQVAVMNWNIATINGGTFSVTSGIEATAIANGGYYDNLVDQGILTINGGVFASTYAIKATEEKNFVGSSRITISGGDFTNDALTALIQPTGVANMVTDNKITINGGSYKGTEENISGLAKATFDSLLGEGKLGTLEEGIYTVADGELD